MKKYNNEVVYINCGGSLDWYKNKSEAMNFFKDCILCSEGSERERYTEIYFSIDVSLNDKKRCFTDGSNYVIRTTIEPERLTEYDKILLQESFNISVKDLYKIEAKKFLSNNHIEICTDNDSDVEELYDLYIKDSLDNKKTYYYFDNDRIVCIDDNSSTENYWSEDFPIEDYKYADMWLNGEIEYQDYLNIKSKQKVDEMII